MNDVLQASKPTRVEAGRKMGASTRCVQAILGDET